MRIHDVELLAGDLAAQNDFYGRILDLPVLHSDSTSLAIGIGTYRAITGGESPRSWLWAGAGSDLVDAVATVAAGSALPTRVRLGLVAVGGGAALVGVVAALDAN